MITIVLLPFYDFPNLLKGYNQITVTLHDPNDDSQLTDGSWEFSFERPSNWGMTRTIDLRHNTKLEYHLLPIYW